MAAKAISIDAGASGLLRHRFVRALAASTLVVMVAIFFGYMAFQSIVDPPPEYKGKLLEQPLFMAFVAVLVLYMIIAGVAALGAVFSIVHRRLTALVLLVLNLFVCVTAWVMFVYSAGVELGLIKADPHTMDDGLMKNMALTFVMLVAGAIAFEGAGWAWWQLHIARLQYFAARGWRPAPWRLNSSTRHMLGLPGFISNFRRGRMLLTATYFLVAVLNAGLIAALVIPLAIFSINNGVSGIAGPLLLIAPFAALLILNAVGVGVLLQKFAARQTTRLYQKARDWDARAPVVFLRAFDQDAQKLKALSIDPFAKFPAGCGAPKTMDELLLEHASVYGPVIAIGDPRDPTPPLGAARVFVSGAGDEWQHVVTSLLGASSVVVMCPSTSEGVKWELDLINDAVGRLKVIYLANPLLTTEQTLALFERLSPKGEFPALKKQQIPIAAFMDAQRSWTVLTTKKPRCVQTYTVALNYALQNLLGMAGTPLPKEQRRAKLKSKSQVQAA